MDKPARVDGLSEVEKLILAAGKIETKQNEFAWQSVFLLCGQGNRRKNGRGTVLKGTSVIRDIKKQFQTAEAYAVYAACMYEPTFEKFLQKTAPLLEDPNTGVYGAFQEELLTGIIVIHCKGGGAAEIKGIAVRETHRRRHIGSDLIEYVLRAEALTELSAETDDDAVLFYRHCGFETETVSMTYGGIPCRRYRCVRRSCQRVPGQHPTGRHDGTTACASPANRCGCHICAAQTGKQTGCG